MNKTTRGIFAALFAFMLMLSTILPALAAEQQTPGISSGAVAELSEGEKYGIFPMEWYFDSFRDGITEYCLDALLAQTKAKIDGLGLDKNGDFTPAKVHLSTPRGDIINALYNIVAQYDLSVGDSAVAYMQDQKRHYEPKLIICAWKTLI